MKSIKFKNNLTIEQMREIVAGAPEWAKYWITRKEYHMSIISFPNMTDQKSFLIDDLRTAIAEHDSREFKVGDLVVSTWGLEKRVLKIVLKPKFKNGILYLTLLIDGVKRECLAQWWRQATNEEIAMGFRS